MSWPFDGLRAGLTQVVIDARTRARQLFGRRGMRARMDEEMRAHVEMREARLVAGGVTPAQAKRKARREFGNMAALRDSAADMWKYGSIERLVQDVRYGMRTLSRAPGFTAIAVLVLALGIGVNATVFTVTNAYLLRLLPVPDASRVVRAYSNNFSNTGQRTYEALRDGNSTLEGLAAFQMVSAGYRLDREIEHTYGQMVSGNYFPLLRVKAGHGRLLDEPDDRAGAPPVAVLSHRFWQSRLAGSRDVVGRTIALNDHAFTVVGVAEPGFSGAMSPLVPDFWVPLSADAVLRPALNPAARSESLSVHMLGRLKADASRVNAEADLDTIGRRLRSAGGDSTNTDRAVSVDPAMMLNPEIAISVGIFTGVLTIIVGLVLMIVCVNVANLVLARAASRGIELAIRQSMGAGRGRLVRQLLTENLLLSGAGAAGGAAVAYVLTQALVRAIAQMPMPFPIELDLSMDWRMLAFLMLVVVGATLTFGAVPALGASKLDLVRVLKGAAGLDRRHVRARTGFLIAQVSMSVLLLVTAGLFILALRSAQTTDTGFDGRQVMTASINLEARGYTPERGEAFLRTLTERLNASPGVVSSNVVDMLPLTLSNRANFLLRDGDVVSPDTRRPPMPIVYQNGVGPWALQDSADRPCRRPGLHVSGHEHRAASGHRERGPRAKVLARPTSDRAAAPSVRPRWRVDRGCGCGARQQVRHCWRGTAPVHVSAPGPGLRATAGHPRSRGGRARFCRADAAAGRAGDGPRPSCVQPVAHGRSDIHFVAAGKDRRRIADGPRRTGACAVRARHVWRAVVPRSIAVARTGHSSRYRGNAARDCWHGGGAGARMDRRGYACRTRDGLRPDTLSVRVSLRRQPCGSADVWRRRPAHRARRLRRGRRPRAARQPAGSVGDAERRVELRKPGALDLSVRGLGRT